MIIEYLEKIIESLLNRPGKSACPIRWVEIEPTDPESDPSPTTPANSTSRVGTGHRPGRRERSTRQTVRPVSPRLTLEDEKPIMMLLKAKLHVWSLPDVLLSEHNTNPR